MNQEHNKVYFFYNTVMPKIYGIGAAVVIAGAMFKLLNWPGGAFMLGLGLTTEAIIFFLGAFEPHPKELDWSKVYPELAEDAPIARQGFSHTKGAELDFVAEKLENLFAQANIDGALIDRLGKGFQSLAASTEHMANLSHLVDMTQQYSSNLEQASGSLADLHQAQSSIVGTVQQFGNIGSQIQDIQENVQVFSENLQKNNAIFDNEMQNIQERFETTKTVQNHLVGSMEQLQEASGEAEKFKLELSDLNAKLSSLNTVYGNMLGALKSQ